VTEEEPFLYTDSSGSYNVFVPAVQTTRPDRPGPAAPKPARPSRCRSSSWPTRHAGPGRSTPPLALGKNLILTPGVYDLNQPIVVSRPDTVVLGLGFATLVPQHGNAAMIVARTTA
jgi:hypothetical protein